MNKVGKAFAVISAVIGIGGGITVAGGVALTLARNYSPEFDNNVKSYVQKNDNAWGSIVDGYTKWWGGSGEATSEVSGISGVSLGLVQSHSDEFWSQANTLFNRDTSKNGSYSYTYTPTTIDTERNDAVGFSYEVVASDNAESQHMSVYVNVIDSKTSYKKVQESVKKLSDENLTESEAEKLIATIEEKLLDVVNNEANTLSFKETNIQEQYGKLAEQLLETIKDEVKDSISGEISNVSVLNVKLNPSARFTTETLYKTAVDENSSVETAEDGTITYTMGTEGTNEYQLTEDDYVKDADGNLLVNEDGKLTYYQHDKDKKGNVLLNKSGKPMRVTDNDNCNITYHDVEVVAQIKVTTKTGDIYYVTKTVTGADVKCDNVSYQSGSRSDATIKADIENSLSKRSNPLINGETKLEVLQVTNPTNLINSNTSIKYENGKTDPSLVSTPSKNSEATAGAKNSSRSVQTTQTFDEATQRAINDAMAEYTQEHWAENQQQAPEVSTQQSTTSTPRRK